MEKERLKRYKEKLDLINTRKDELGEWSDDFFSDEKTKLASYKAFQEIAEAVFDIIAMMLKDKEKIPGDDYSNIDRLFQLKLIDGSLQKSLKEANGLRNRVIHEYNGLNDRTAFESIETLKPSIGKFVEIIEKWIKNN